MLPQSVQSFPQFESCPAWLGDLAQFALEHGGEPALLADAEGGLLYANSAACELLGYDQKELLERRLGELLPELPRLLAKAAVSSETEAHHRDGRRLAVEVVLSHPVVDGRRFQFAFVREIGKRKRLEDQLRESRRMEAVGRLVTGVSHDFNNLLTAILIYAGLLLDQLPAGSPLRRQAEQVNVAAERGRSLVSQLTALGERRGFEPTLLSLNEVVESVRDMLMRLLGENISLETNYGECLGVVRADRIQIERLLVNLAVNARDAMPQGGVLRIATANFIVAEGAGRKPGMTPGQYVRLAVSDTGCGMDEETRALAPEPFFTTKPPGQGTGLGLSIVYEIVRQSGGQILLESAPGRGTQVEVFLPRVEGEAEKLLTPFDQQVRVSGTATVLVVEDEELVRRSLFDILEGKGYRVLQARNAREAVLIAQNHKGPIDLMLTDLVLPGIGGSELADELRPARPDMRVLYISGYRNDVRVRRLEQAGKSFFSKPFTAAGIAEKVHEVLAERRRDKGRGDAGHS